TAPLERGGHRVRRRARDHAAGQRAARREPPDPAVVGGERADEQYYGQVPRTHRAAGQNRRYVHDLPDAFITGPGTLRLAMAESGDAWRSLRPRLPWNDRTFLGRARTRGGRCQ